MRNKISLNEYLLFKLIELHGEPFYSIIKEDNVVKFPNHPEIYEFFDNYFNGLKS